MSLSHYTRNILNIKDENITVEEDCVELKKIKEEKGTIIAIGGCMMQEKHITDKIKESYPFVDILFGTHTIHKLPGGLKKVLRTKQKQEDKIENGGKIN